MGITVQRNLSVYNLRDANILGDGSDEAAKITAFIAATPVGSTIIFPSPSSFYGVGATPIIFLAGRTYKGSSIGSNAPTIKALSGSAATALFVATEYWNNQTFAGGPLTIENLTFDGASGATQGNNWTATTNSGLHGVILQNSYCVIRACHFNNIDGAGILLTNAVKNGSLVTNSLVENHIESCRFQTVGVGIWGRESGANIGTDGYIRDCVVGNSYNLTLAGIQMERGGGWFLSGNHIYNAMGHGIVVKTAWATSVISNEIDGFGQSAFTTTLTNAIGSTGSQSVQVGSSSNYAVSQYISIDTAGNQEAVQITAIADGTHITCNFGQTHLAGVTITGGAGAFYSGITVSTTSSRPTVVAHNIIATATEPNPNTHYQHLSIQMQSGVGITECMCIGNEIYGGYVSTGTQNSGFSQAFNFQTGATGNASNIVSIGNRANNVGRQIFTDSNTTMIAAIVHSDLQLDRHLTANNEQYAAPVLAALAANGTTPPTPVFSSLGGTDVRGKVSFGSGSGTPTTGNQVSVTFNKAYGANPAVLVAPMNAATAALQPYIDTTTQSTTVFNIGFGVAPAASQAAGTYQVCFIVIG